MATWNGVITNAGNSLLNEWVNEKTLNFDSAAAGLQNWNLLLETSCFMLHMLIFFFEILIL